MSASDNYDNICCRCSLNIVQHQCWRYVSEKWKLKAESQDLLAQAWSTFSWGTCIYKSSHFDKKNPSWVCCAFENNVWKLPLQDQIKRCYSPDCLKLNRKKKRCALIKTLKVEQFTKTAANSKLRATRIRFQIFNIQAARWAIFLKRA